MSKCVIKSKATSYPVRHWLHIGDDQAVVRFKLTMRGDALVIACTQRGLELHLTRKRGQLVLTARKVPLRVKYARAYNAKKKP